MKILVSRKKNCHAIVIVSFLILAVLPGCSSDKKSIESSGLLKKAKDLKKAGYYFKAIPLMEKAVTINRKESAGRDTSIAQSLDLLGELCYLAGNYKKAEPFLKESLMMRKEKFGPEHIETAKSYNHLGVLYTFLGKYDDAKACFIKAIAIREKAYAKDHPDVVEALLNQSRLKLYTQILHLSLVET